MRTRLIRRICPVCSQPSRARCCLNRSKHIRPPLLKCDRRIALCTYTVRRTKRGLAVTEYVCHMMRILVPQYPVVPLIGAVVEARQPIDVYNICQGWVDRCMTTTICGISWLPANSDCPGYELTARLGFRPYVALIHD